LHGKKRKKTHKKAGYFSIKETDLLSFLKSIASDCRLFVPAGKENKMRFEEFSLKKPRFSGYSHAT